LGTNEMLLLVLPSTLRRALASLARGVGAELGAAVERG